MVRSPINELVIKLDTYIKKIESDIEEVKSQLKIINSNIIENSADLKYLKKDIYGNGKKGLIQRVEFLEIVTKNEDFFKEKVILNEKNIENINKKVAYVTGVCAVVSFLIISLRDIIFNSLKNI